MPFNIAVGQMKSNEHPFKGPKRCFTILSWLHSIRTNFLWSKADNCHPYYRKHVPPLVYPASGPNRLCLLARSLRPRVNPYLLVQYSLLFFYTILIIKLFSWGNLGTAKRINILDFHPGTEERSGFLSSSSRFLSLPSIKILTGTIVFISPKRCGSSEKTASGRISSSTSSQFTNPTQDS